ncbi:hypothetical protein Y032_0061g3253 [Ancylostoma ceylanicum]|nr:hypothetical protein Y032_0061g3253 [Ancylostoma ceylanicum]
MDFTVEVPPGKFQCFFQPVDVTKHKTMEVDYQVVDGGDLNINFMILMGANMLVQENMKTDGSHRLDLQTSGDYQVCFDNSFSYQSRKVCHRVLLRYCIIFVFFFCGFRTRQETLSLLSQLWKLNYRSEQVVFFEIFLMNEKGEVDDMDLSGMAHKDAGLEKRMEEFGVTVAGFHSSANRIKSQLNKIEYHQALLRAHEARDRAVMVANLDRVTFWSCTHTLVLIGVGALQVSGFSLLLAKVSPLKGTRRMLIAYSQVFMIRSLFEDNSKLGQFLRKGRAAY